LKDAVSVIIDQGTEFFGEIARFNKGQRHSYTLYMGLVKVPVLADNFDISFVTFVTLV
jgi:hypothetical protein